MSVYLSMILLTMLIGGLYNNFKRKNVISNIFIIILLSLWVFIYALRFNTGSDFSGYYYMFNRIGLYNDFADFISTKRDLLYYSLEYIVYTYFDKNWLLLSFIVALLTYVPVLLVIKKNNEYFLSSVLLYIFTLSYFFGFNGIRQGVAISICYFAYYIYFINKKYILYFVLMLFAFGFHSTALFIVPFHYFSMTSITSKKTIILYIILIISYLFLWNGWQYLINFLEFIGQDKMASDYLNATSNGSSFIRVLVDVVPALLSIIYYKRLKTKYKLIDCEINLVLLSAIFMLFSTKYWLFARISSYFKMSVILLIPKLSNIFTKESEKLGMIIILLLYFIYMILLLLHGDGELLPYTFYKFY